MVLFCSLLEASVILSSFFISSAMSAFLLKPCIFARVIGTPNVCIEFLMHRRNFKQVYFIFESDPFFLWNLRSPLLYGQTS